MTDTRGAVGTAQDSAVAQDAVAAPSPKLADPPIPGGRVEAMMGLLIRVLASSPLARPLPAMSLSALGLGLDASTRMSRPIIASTRPPGIGGSASFGLGAAMASCATAESCAVLTALRVSVITSSGANTSESCSGLRGPR